LAGAPENELLAIGIDAKSKLKPIAVHLAIVNREIAHW
jgi:hypothetical protein